LSLFTSHRSRVHLWAYAKPIVVTNAIGFGSTLTIRDSAP
jgi:hypothetical protein